MKDLIVLVADGNTDSLLKGLFTRYESLETRPFAYDMFVHPESDPGVLLEAHEFLRPYRRAYARALVMFDKEGCGQEHKDRTALEAEIEKRLCSCGWDGRVAAVVLDPELEVWVWGDSAHVSDVLGWSEIHESLYARLREDGWFSGDRTKPDRPKEAVEWALRQARKPRSSSIYRRLAEKASWRSCTDTAFHKLVSTLQVWFPVNATD